MDSVLSKRNSLTDVPFFISKIIIIFIFVFDKQKENEHWGIIIFLCLISGINAYCNLFIKNNSNILIKKFNYFFSLALFWSYMTLLIQKIFENSSFDGGLYLFSLGIILIILFCFCYNKNNTNFLSINFNNIKYSIDNLNYIKQYLKIIDEKDISRDSLLIFNSFIEKAEEKCTNKRCALKQYLESLSKGINSKFLLLQYAEKLFKLAISKFPQDIILKINYVIFLYTKINKKKEAKTELIQIKPKFFSFNDKYNLYICQKYIEEYFLLINEKNKEKIETFNMIQALEYKNSFNEFKNFITKSSGLYYEFWSSLYNCHLQGTEDISKLNEIGNKINKLIEQIDKIYLKLNEIKNNDYEVIKLYELFIKNILNNKDKYKKVHHISMNLVNHNTAKNKEIDYTNFDVSILNELDDNNYLLISADEENKGTIINMSLGACSIFGYHKNELIGKNMNILIPELFQKLHERVFNNLAEKTKTEFYDKLVNKIAYKPEITESHKHAKNKSKYLIPLFVKVYLVETEENELVFIVEINRKNSFKDELEDNFVHNNENENICCILTDDNLKIKTFSSNCVDILKLNSNIINSNYEITSFIKQLNDDFISNLTTTNKEISEFEVSNITNEENSMLKLNEIDSNKKINVNSIINNSIDNTIKNKKKLIKTKFLFPRKITWKIESTDKASVLYSEKFKNNTLSFLLNDNTFENENKYEKNFLMVVKEAYILNKHVGYYFYFKKLKNVLNKNKSLRSSKKIRLKRNSRFKDINVEEVLHYNYKKEDKSPNIQNYKGSLSHKNVMLFEDNNKDNIEQKKNSNELFDLENTKIKKFEDENNINDNFTPNCNFNFTLDLDSFSFKPSNIIHSSLDLEENLKNQANNKIKILEKKTKSKKTSSSPISNSKSSSSKENSSSEESSSMLYSYDMNSSQYDNKKEDLNLSKNYIGNKNINKNNNFFEQYYKVNIKSIKFIIYDFNREKFVENIKEEKKSQMENLIENYKLNKNNYINDDDNYPNYSNSNYSKDKVSNKDIQIDKSNTLINKSQSQSITKYEKEKDFEKEIIDSLAKKDEQKAIFQFYLSIIICTIIFLIMNILEIIYINISYRKLSENIKLLINSINLKYYNNFDVYFLRELLLIHIQFTNFTNNYTYYNYPLKNKRKASEYSKDIYEASNISFYQSHSLIESIFSSDLALSKNASYIIDEMPYFSETLISGTNIKTLNSSLSISIIYVYSFFCNILTDTNEINIKNPESFNFIHNAINNLGKGLRLLNELFFSELKKRESNILKNLIFIICANSIIYFIIYLINNSSYFRVVNKKMSYLTVFYEIKLPSIKSSIKKCETFINKINKEDKKFERIGKIKESSINSYSLSNIDSNNLTLNKEEMKSIIDYKKEEKNNVEKKVEIDKKKDFYQISFIIGLLISFFCLCIVIVIYYFAIENFIFIGDYIIHMQNYHNNIIELFNAYREFLYEENTIIFDMPSYEYLIHKEKEIYSTNTKNLRFLNSNYKKFEIIIKELTNIKLCDLYINFYFENKEQCENYFGGKEGIINLDFELLINYFVQEIRMKRNEVYKYIKNKLLVGNLTDLNDQQFWNDEYLNLTNKSLIFRLELFNKEEIHNKLNIMYIHIIYQYINKVRNLTMNEAINIIYNRHINCIVLISFHCFIAIIIILLYWVPKIKLMNIEIYKTKNMLSIIPVQILASLPNIKKLLNISTKNN